MLFFFVYEYKRCWHTMKDFIADNYLYSLWILWILYSAQLFVDHRLLVSIIDVRLFVAFYLLCIYFWFLSWERNLVNVLFFINLSFVYIIIFGGKASQAFCNYDATRLAILSIDWTLHHFLFLLLKHSLFLTHVLSIDIENILVDRLFSNQPFLH